MNSRRIALALSLVVFLGAWVGVTSVNSAHAETTAQNFIEGLGEEAVNALTVEGVSRADRIERFTELLNHNFDVATIGKWVLGRYWRTATDAEKEEYLKLFEEYVVITYVERFNQYSGERLKVIKSVSEPGQDSLVFSEIQRPTGGEPIRVDWRVHAEADVYKIIDVYVEGISMSQTQRKEFSSVIRSNGGTVAGLLNALRTQIDKLNQ
ncbi:MAG TPA: ABC transporter substrate-binding protein [Magnetovibrio sp.]